MTKLEKIVDAIECGKSFRAGSLMVTPHGNAFSYNVCIYDYDSNTLHTKKYSSTTSGHQNLIREALHTADFTPQGTYSETEESLNKDIV